MKETHLQPERQTVKLGLLKVVRDLFPGEVLKTAYSIEDGVYCQLVKSVLSEREVRQIAACLEKWVEANQPIEFLYSKDGYYQYCIGGDIIKSTYPALIEPAAADPFRIVPFDSGFIVDFSEIRKEEDSPFILPQKLAQTYTKTHNWLENIGLELVEDLNRYIRTGRSWELISIAEALQEKEISDISDAILKERRALRVILISGPSSSGKTTFLNRLSTQLRVNGLKPLKLSLDDYFVNRDQTPKDKEGKHDFESLEALDLKLLHKHIKALIAGEAVETPIFDFISGQRAETTKMMQLHQDEILVVEGIHALNPKLMPSVYRNMFFKIYISALFGPNLDMGNRVSTTEVRLLRRMVRDERCRGATPERTFEMWSSVRRGEHRNVFNFQEEADVMFNSSLLYEMNALRPFAEKTLEKVDKNGVHKETLERLLNFVAFFEPIPTDKIPFHSIIREFIGGSIYFDC